MCENEGRPISPLSDLQAATDTVLVLRCKSRNGAQRNDGTIWYNVSMQTFKIEQTDLQCVVTWRYLCVSVFPLIIFFAGWTAMLVFMTCMAFAHQQFEVLLFLLPFWAVSLGLFAVIAHMLFGKTRFVLDANGIKTIYTCLRFRHEKHIDIAEIRRFEKSVHRGNKRRTRKFRVICQNKNVDFCPPESEIDNLCNRLNGFLGTLKEESIELPAKWEAPAPMVLGLESPPQHLEPPAKSRWQYQTELAGLCFQCRGKGRISKFFVWILTAVLYNGLLIPFVLAMCGVIEPDNPLEGLDWWFLLFIVIGVGIGGIVFCVVAFNSFLNLFRRTSWRFAHGEAVFHTARIRSRTTHHDLTGWNSLAIRVVRAEKDKEPKDNTELRKFYEEGDHWQVAFRDKNGTDLAVINNLSKPEALWMADVILREQRAIR